MKRSLALYLRYCPSTARNSLLAGFAVPDPNRMTLDGIFAAKGADVPGVLGDLHLLHLLSKRGAISVGQKVINRMHKRGLDC